MGLGGGNPFPFVLGGGKSPTQQAHDALKSAVGDGGSAADGTIEAEWRVARSRGLAASMADDRAAAQAFPDTATDYIPVFEDILGLLAVTGLSEQERRDNITSRWASAVDATGDSIEDELQEIDPRFSVLSFGDTTTAVTAYGRAFEDFDTTSSSASGPAFDIGFKHTNLPNFSHRYTVLVEFAITAGVISENEKRLLNEAKDLLNRALPAWVGFMIVTDTAGGFILDTSLLDIGAFNP